MGSWSCFHPIFYQNLIKRFIFSFETINRSSGVHNRNSLLIVIYFLTYLFYFFLQVALVRWVCTWEVAFWVKTIDNGSSFIQFTWNILNTVSVMLLFMKFWRRWQFCLKLSYIGFLIVLCEEILWLSFDFFPHNHWLLIFIKSMVLELFS